MVSLMDKVWKMETCKAPKKGSAKQGRAGVDGQKAEQICGKAHQPAG